MSLGEHVKILSRTPPLVSGPIHQFIEWTNVEDLKYKIKDNETIIHTISTNVPSAPMANLHRDAFENICINIQLLEHICSLPNSNLIFISSGGAVYGTPTKSIIDETHSTNPVSSYGLTKLVVEKYLHLFRIHKALKYIVIRPSNLYGVGQNFNTPQGIISHILKAILEKRPIEIWGEGNSLKDYLHIDDFTKALTKVVLKPNFDHPVLNLSSGYSSSINELISIIESLTNQDLKKKYLTEKKFDVPEILIDSDKFRSIYKWNPKINIQLGIEKTIKHMNFNL